MFRAAQMTQDKAQTAENGMSFSRPATPYWVFWVAPFGRIGKCSFAVLRPSTSRFAESVNITLKKYQA